MKASRHIGPGLMAIGLLAGCREFDEPTGRGLERPPSSRASPSLQARRSG